MSEQWQEAKAWEVSGEEIKNCNTYLREKKRVKMICDSISGISLIPEDIVMLFLFKGLHSSSQ